jgi:hypothetical protein
LEGVRMRKRWWWWWCVVCCGEERKVNRLLGLVVVALGNIILGGGGRQILRCGQDRTRGTPPNRWGKRLTCAILTTRALTSRVIFTSLYSYDTDFTYFTVYTIILHVDFCFVNSLLLRACFSNLI